MGNLARHNKLFYGVGNLGYGVVSQTYTNLIMSFGTIALGMPGTLMGIAVAISVLWDAFTDPVVGYLSDTKKSGKFGKRHGYLLFGTIGMALVNIVLWLVPNGLSVGTKFAWLLISMLLLETFNTLFATPYTALGTEITDDYNERTNVQAYKTVFFLLGLVIPSLLIFIFFPSVGVSASEQFKPFLSYQNISYITSAICVICGLICFFGTKKFIKSIGETKHYDVTDNKQRPIKMIFKDFFSTLKNKEYRKVVFGYAIALISTAFLTSTGIHFFTYTFMFTSGQISVLLGILVTAAILSQPFWIYLAKKLDKRPTLLIGITISFIGILIITVLFLTRDLAAMNVKYILCCIAIFVSGFGSGVLYNLPISMFSDIANIEFARTKKEMTATYSGFMTFAFKSANAIASLVIGVMLDLIGFNSQIVGEQPLSVQNGMGWLLIGGVFLSLMGGLLIFSKYRLTRRKVKILIDEAKETQINFENEEE